MKNILLLLALLVAGTLGLVQSVWAQAATTSPVDVTEAALTTTLTTSVAVCPPPSGQITTAFDRSAEAERRADAVRGIADCRDTQNGSVLAVLSEEDSDLVRSEALRGLVLLDSEVYDRTVSQRQQSSYAVGGAVIAALEARADAETLALLERTATSSKVPAPVRHEARSALLRLAPEFAQSVTSAPSGWLLTTLAGATTGGLLFGTLGAVRERSALPPLGFITGGLLGGTAGYIVARQARISSLDSFRIASYTGIGLASGFAIGRGRGNDRARAIQGGYNYGSNYTHAEFVRKKWTYGISTIGAAAGLTLGMTDRHFGSRNRIGLVDTGSLFGLVTGTAAANLVDGTGTEHGGIVAAAILGGAIWGRTWADVGTRSSNFGLIAALPVSTGLTITLVQRATRQSLEQAGAWGTLWSGVAGLGAITLSRYDVLNVGEAAALAVGSTYGTILSSGIGLLATPKNSARTVSGIAAAGSVVGAGIGYTMAQFDLTSSGGGVGMALGTAYGMYHGPTLALALSENSGNFRAFGGVWLTNVGLLGTGGYALGHGAQMSSSEALSLALAAGSGSLLGTQIANAGGASGQSIWIGSVVGGDVALLGVGVAVLAADVEPLYATLGSSLSLAGAGLGAFTALYAARSNSGEALSAGTAIGLMVGAGAGVGTAHAVLSRRKTQPIHDSSLAPRISRLSHRLGYQFARLEPLSLAATDVHATTPMGVQLVFAEIAD